MYLKYFGLKHEPLATHAASPVDEPQFDKLQCHFSRLLETKGLALVTGMAGVGKTTALRLLTKKLNPHQYLTLYQAENHFQAFDIYCQLADALGLEKRHRYSLLWRDIKQHIVHLVDDKKITPIWILDEAHQLPTNFLLELPAFLNFAFDTRMPLIIILVGLPTLAHTLSKSAFSVVASRLQFQCQWQPISDVNHFADFIKHAFKIAGTENVLFSDSGLQLIYMACEGRLRYAHRILSKSLQIAASQQMNHLSDEIIHDAIDALKCGA